ncbi:hypothetical protein ACROYT_G030949 [Oculina patagonica]
MAEGRFRSPKTIEEEELCVERAVPKSTRYKNKWAIGIFEDWQRVRSVNVPILEVGGVFKEYALHSPKPWDSKSRCDFSPIYSYFRSLKLWNSKLIM